MHFLPWWALVACLAASALAAYLLLVRTQAGNSPWALFPLSAVLAPALLAGAAVAAVVLSTLLSVFLEDRPATPGGQDEPPRRAEGTGPEAAPRGAETTQERSVPATPDPTASPSASPSASPAASPSPAASSPAPSSASATP